MRILQVINGEFYSGAERVQDLLACNLKSFDFEVDFACIKPGRFPGERRAKEALLHLIPMRSRFDLHIGFRLAEIVRKHGYRLIHTHSPRAALVGNLAARFSGVPMIHHVHSPTSRDTENAWRNRVNSTVEDLSLLGVSHLIPVSRSLERHLLDRRFNHERLSLVANGVPTPGPLPARELPGEVWTIGSVALFRPRKGLEVLLEALSRLAKAGTALRLRAVGPFETAEYERTILALADRLQISDLIEWVGFTSDVNAELSRMDLFVLPSLFGEGMPMVLLEAMAMGVPVVASNVEGIPEVIEDGRSGLVVPPNDAETLARVLGRTIGDVHTWELLRLAAYERQVKLFSAESMSRGVAQVYRKVLSHE